MLRKFILFYSDPGVGFPWLGSHGTFIGWYRLKNRGFGLWLWRERYLRPRLCIGFWWVYAFELQAHCTPLVDSRVSNLFPNLQRWAAARARRAAREKE